MQKTIFVIVVVVVVAVVLAGGTAFIMQQNKLNEFNRLAAQAEEKMEAKDYGEAIGILKKIEARGETPRSAFLLGKAYYEQGKYEDALPYFAKVAKKYSRSAYVAPALLYNGRYALEVEGKTSAAKEDFLKILESYSSSDVADNALYYLSRISYDEGDIQQAKKNLDQIMKHMDSPAKDQSEFLLGDINMKMLKSPDPGPGDEVYTIKKGDSIWKLERSLKVPGDLIVGINGLKPNALTVGQQIKVPRVDISVAVDKAHRTLTIRNRNAFLKKYRIGINGVDSKVPAAEYQVQAKFDKGYEYVDPQTNVTYKPGDPNNPLGTRFIQLRRDMGIHGTNEEDMIGKYISKGYIAMTNPDVEELYSLVQVKTPVSVKGKNLAEAASVTKK